MDHLLSKENIRDEIFSKNSTGHSVGRLNPFGFENLKTLMQRCCTQFGSLSRSVSNHYLAVKMPASGGS